MEGKSVREVPSSGPLVLALLAGFLLVVLVIQNQVPFIFYLRPFYQSPAPATLSFLANTLVAFLISACVIGLLAMTTGPSGQDEFRAALDRLGRLCYGIVMYGLLAVVTLELFAILDIYAVLFVILEAGLLAVFLVLYRRRSVSKGPSTP